MLLQLNGPEKLAFKTVLHECQWHLQFFVQNFTRSDVAMQWCAMPDAYDIALKSPSGDNIV